LILKQFSFDPGKDIRGRGDYDFGANSEQDAKTFKVFSDTVLFDGIVPVIAGCTVQYGADKIGDSL
jgi:hypothetical protein